MRNSVLQPFLRFRLGHLLLLFALSSVLLGLYAPYFRRTYDKSKTRVDFNRFVRAQADLERAVQKNDLELARSALECGFTYEQLTAGRLPLLRIGVARGQIAMVELLLKVGADVHQSGRANWPVTFGPPPRVFYASGPPLFSAIGINQPAETRIEMIKLLVVHGANPRHTGEESAMDVAVRECDAEVADLLRALGVPYGPREMATFNRLVELQHAVAKAPDLIKQRFVPVWAAGEGQGPTLLGIALSQGHREMAQWLVNSGATIDTIEEMGESLLHKAARGGDPVMIDRLIKSGLDANARRYDGDTPLHWAAAKGHTEVVSQLLEAGAKINNQMLFSSGSLEHPEILAQLIAAGADPSASDSQGRTVLDVARKSGNNATVSLLEKAQQTARGKHP